MREDMKAARQEWERWLQAESVDEETRGQLRAMDDAQVLDSFYRDLTFGTGGLRGELGAGIALLPRRPEGQKHRGPRRRRPIGGLAPGIPGVVDRFCHGSTFCLSQE